VVGPPADTGSVAPAVGQPAPALRSKFTELRDEMKRRRSAAPPVNFERSDRSTSPTAAAQDVDQAGTQRRQSPFLDRGGHIPAVANALRQVQSVVQQAQVRRQGGEQANSAICGGNSSPSTGSTMTPNQGVSADGRISQARAQDQCPSSIGAGEDLSVADGSSVGIDTDMFGRTTDSGSVDICLQLTPKQWDEQQGAPPTPCMVAAPGSPSATLWRSPSTSHNVEVGGSTQAGSSLPSTSSALPGSPRPGGAPHPVPPISGFSQLRQDGTSNPHEVASTTAPAAESPGADQSCSSGCGLARSNRPQPADHLVSSVGRNSLLSRSTGGLASPRGPADQKVASSPRGATTEDADSDNLYKALVNFCQQRALQQMPIRVAADAYLFGNKKLHLALRNGRLLVRMGNSYIPLTDGVLNSPTLGSGGSGNYAAQPVPGVGMAIVGNRMMQTHIAGHVMPAAPVAAYGSPPVTRAWQIPAQSPGPAPARVFAAQVP